MRFLAMQLPAERIVHYASLETLALKILARMNLDAGG